MPTGKIRTLCCMIVLSTCLRRQTKNTRVVYLATPPDCSPSQLFHECLAYFN